MSILESRIAWIVLALLLSHTHIRANDPHPRIEPSHVDVQHVKVYAVPGRFGGWPANHGIWSWGDEILVGFSAGYHKDLGPERHNIDREKPEEHLLARSMDGGLTWSIENPAKQGSLLPSGSALHGIEDPNLPKKPSQDSPGGIHFLHPDFAMTVRMADNHVGPSRYYYSLDRGRHWNGPFKLPNVGTQGIAARTDYLVLGKDRCMLFVTAAKSNLREGRPCCIETTDGGKTWNFVAWMGEEPKGYSIMPSTIRIRENEFLSSVRCRHEKETWVELFRTRDQGRTWSLESKPVTHLGEGNPTSLVRMQDGRLCLTYGFRAKPFGIRAIVSNDDGKSWGPELHLRDDGGGRDIGYPRTVQRSDGKLVTIYYFHDEPASDRYIAATIWSP